MSEGKHIKVIHYNGTKQWWSYLIWGLLLTNYEYKHTMKWNIVDKHFGWCRWRRWQCIHGDDYYDNDQFKEKQKQTNV